MGSLALLLWYTPHAEGEGGDPCPLSCALGRTRGPPPTPSRLVLMCPPTPPTGGSPGPLAQYTSLSHPCSKRSIPSVQVPQPQAGILFSGLPLGGGFAAQPFPCGHRGSSPSFSHCELSVGVYTTLTYLFIACGKGRIAGKQCGELAAPSLCRGTHARCVLSLSGSILCSPPSSLAQHRNE